MNRPPDRRDRIKQAARTCFLARGYVATSIADIRKQSGATTGSIYHFYENKAALAAELFEDAISGWRNATEQATAGAAPRDMIRASVAGLVLWAMEEPRMFLLMDEISSLAPKLPELARCAELLQGGQAQASGFYDRAVQEGLLRPMPWPFAHALMLGPAHHFLRGFASGRVAAEMTPAETAAFFAGAAWDAVRAP